MPKVNLNLRSRFQTFRTWAAPQYPSATPWSTNHPSPSNQTDHKKRKKAMMMQCRYSWTHPNKMKSKLTTPSHSLILHRSTGNSSNNLLWKVLRWIESPIKTLLCLSRLRVSQIIETNMDTTSKTKKQSSQIWKCQFPRMTSIWPITSRLL